MVQQPVLIKVISEHGMAPPTQERKNGRVKVVNANTPQAAKEPD